MGRLESRVLAALAAGGLALTGGGLAHAQNTIGGDVFPPGVADFPQNGSNVGRGAAFQFTDEFYAANGVDGPEIRRQESLRPDDGLAPGRFFAFYRGPGDVGIAPADAPEQDPEDDRFLPYTRHTLHNMGFNAAGEQLYYPDPPAFLFESAFLNEETKDLTNRSFVFIFPRTVDQPSTIAGCEEAPFLNDLLAPGACNRRQDNIFDTGNGYLTSNPLGLWRIMFVTWDGPDVDTPACQAEMAKLAERNGLDIEGTPIITSTFEVLKVATADVIGGQGEDAVVVPNVLPASGLPNPDPRNTIPGVEPREGGEVCVTVQTRRQEDEFGNPARPDDPLTEENEALDGAPFVV